MPQNSIKVSLLPLEGKDSLLEGTPGLTTFMVRGIVRVENVHPTKYKNLLSVKAEFAGITSTQNAVGPGRASMVQASRVAHFQKEENLVLEPTLETTFQNTQNPATGSSRLPPLGPKQTKDFPFCFIFSSPREGGPPYLPHTFYWAKQFDEAFTTYILFARVRVPRKKRKEPQQYSLSTKIPILWHDIDHLEDFIRGPEFIPKPGWYDGAPVNLPPSAKEQPDNSPVYINVTLPNGPNFDLGGDFEFTWKVTPSPVGEGLGGIKIKSFTLQIVQTIILKAGSPPFLSTSSDAIFEWKSPPHTDFTRQQSVSTSLKPNFTPNDVPNGKMAVATRKGPNDGLFLVDHAVRVIVAVQGAPDVMVLSPATVHGWGRKEMGEWVKANGEMIREVVFGLAPEYVDAPVYVPPDAEIPGYEEATR